MKAVLSRSVGGPESLVLEDMPDPQPSPAQVVVQVKACGVNYPDILIIEDRYQSKPERPFSPGGEIAGVVSAVGEAVSQFRPGDRVMAWCNWGGMAERILLDVRNCFLMPDTMPFDEGAAFILTFGTSYYALENRAQLQAGETLLVLGAAGGVGLAAVELGKAMGARVIAAASSSDKVELAKAHGADAGVVYPLRLSNKNEARALTDLFKDICGESGVDVVYDAVGGAYAEAALRATNWEGRFLVVGFPAGIPQIPLNLVLLKSCQIVGVFWGAWIEREHGAFAESTRQLLSLYSKGVIRPHISERFPLERAHEAISWLAARKAMGKVVVVVS
jgi:NADPH:quinone reductase